MPPKKIIPNIDDYLITSEFIKQMNKSPAKAWKVFKMKTLTEQAVCAKRIEYSGTETLALARCMEINTDPKLFAALLKLTPRSELLKKASMTGSTFWHNILSTTRKVTLNKQLKHVTAFLALKDIELNLLLIEPNKEGITPIELAFRHGTEETAQTLLKALESLVAKGKLEAHRLETLYPTLYESAIYTAKINLVEYFGSLNTKPPQNIAVEMLPLDTQDTYKTVMFLNKKDIPLQFSSVVKFFGFFNDPFKSEAKIYAKHAKPVLDSLFKYFLACGQKNFQQYFYHDFLSNLANTNEIHYNSLAIKSVTFEYCNLNLINQCFDKYKWPVDPTNVDIQALALSAITEYPKLLLTLVKRGLDLTIPFNSAQKRSSSNLAQAIVQFSDDPRLLKLINKDNNFSSDHFNRTLAHEAMQFSTNLPQRAGSIFSLDQTAPKYTADIGSVAAVSAVFNLTNFQASDKVGYTPVEYALMNPNPQRRLQLRTAMEPQRKALVSEIQQLTSILSVIVEGIVLVYLGFPSIPTKLTKSDNKKFPASKRKAVLSITEARQQAEVEEDTRQSQALLQEWFRSIDNFFDLYLKGQRKDSGSSIIDLYKGYARTEKRTVNVQFEKALRFFKYLSPHKIYSWNACKQLEDQNRLRFPLFYPGIPLSFSSNPETPLSSSNPGTPLSFSVPQPIVYPFNNTISEDHFPKVSSSSSSLSSSSSSSSSSSFSSSSWLKLPSLENSLPDTSMNLDDAENSSMNSKLYLDIENTRSFEIPLLPEFDMNHEIEPQQAESTLSSFSVFRSPVKNKTSAQFHSSSSFSSSSSSTTVNGKDEVQDEGHPSKAPSQFAHNNSVLFKSPKKLKRKKSEDLLTALEEFIPKGAMMGSGKKELRKQLINYIQLIEEVAENNSKICSILHEIENDKELNELIEKYSNGYEFHYCIQSCLDSLGDKNSKRTKLEEILQF